MILGIDEAGRGPWAGPLVVGAVILGGARIDGLTDSKKLTKKRREALHDEITRQAAAYASGWVSARELDEIGMSAALRLATRRAVEEIQAQCREKSLAFDEIIIDGTVNFLADTALGRYVTVMAKADGLVPSVSAASIIAKVERDRYMAKQDEAYPGYGFGRHAGYGVKAHREAIEKLGVCPEHRLSFAPLQKYRTSGAVGESALPIRRAQHAAPSPTTRQVGNASEDAAANYLVRAGHKILERNWRTKWCEIDIVSCKNGVIYFTEVKHRKNNKAGDGLAAITPTKLRQMRFAATLYATLFKESQDMRLSAIATTGDPPEVTDYLDTL